MSTAKCSNPDCETIRLNNSVLSARYERQEFEMHNLNVLLNSLKYELSIKDQVIEHYEKAAALKQTITISDVKVNNSEILTDLANRVAKLEALAYYDMKG